MNFLALTKKAEQKKQKLYQAQMVITKKTACPVR
jgi:hypothetical protein